MVIEGDHAMHLGARQVQRGGDLRDRIGRNVSERILDSMQDRQQRAGAALLCRDDRSDLFGLDRPDSFCFILQHPDRLTKYANLNINVPYNYCSHLFGWQVITAPLHPSIGYILHI